MSFYNSYFMVEYQDISNKLKKKRILKKPNVAEASQQYENLGKVCEREDLPEYAGFCYHAAAKCQNSLGNTLEESFLLLKASRRYMDGYSRLINKGFVLNETYLVHSCLLYKECLLRLENFKKQSKSITDALRGVISLEVRKNLKEKADRIIEERTECSDSNSIVLFESPLEKIFGLQKLISFQIEVGNYENSVCVVTDIIKEAQFLPDSKLKNDILCDSQITIIFLLLILQPTPQQISSVAASILEKYAWVETSSSNDVKDLQTFLKKKELHMLSENLFLILQSLVMACQYCDIQSLVATESDLMPYLSNDQKTLLKVLIKQYII